ncbi:MAG: hypothetical protein U9O96_00055 [Candidatus Thermoplasmatota archaeon]|nr:hypothetical protein [Candidatus Thermoplasmatota archaeon]
MGRPFDFVSPWYTWWGGLYTKQKDGSYGIPGHNYPGYGYYCSELTWASWKHAYIDLDTDNGPVWPGELARNSRVDIYYQHGSTPD